MTVRAVTLAFAALLLYFFAIQTQIGWLYVMAALLAGTLIAAAILNRAALGKIALERAVGESPEAELHEGDEVSVRLTLRNGGRAPAAQVQGIEACPLAAPDDARRVQRLFIPQVAPGANAEFAYAVTADRRGVQRFPPLSLASRAPFGLFHRRGQAGEPQAVLVYPELRPLGRFDLLDRQPVAALAHVRAGHGTEVLGVRPFRSGDPPRHIHWRSVARTGQLISKEFADETSPGLALVLDAGRHPYAEYGSKHTPFEWAVKIALSLGDYALRHAYPLTLVADDSALAVPPGPISSRALREYLAKIQPEGTGPAAEVLAGARRTVQRFAAVVLPWPERQALAPLVALQAGGLEVVVVLLDPQSFPGGGPSSGILAGELQAAGLDTRLVRFGEDWVEGLEAVAPMRPAPARIGNASTARMA